ncbi:MAG: molecular chaperone HtpG [Steroidobacteraceae bacterium]
MSQATETRGFQAEVRELLKLMIHSLYSHREIFLRELISNASDANDKLRFAALADPALLEGGGDPAIRIEVDDKAGTLTVTDTGLGMTREEAILHLGTIAKSGTAEFFKRLTGDEQKDSQLIGQFGVGFYSSFIVADEVEVLTRKAGTPAGEGVRWASKADGEYTVGPIERAARGTSVVLHLKGEAREFLDPFRLRALVRRYSDHIAFPVEMRKDGSASLDYEAVNQARALWTRPRTEVSDEEYREFYQHVAHDFEPPLAWSHNKVEGRREYTSLLYVPGHAPFDLWQRDRPHGLKLYVRRVFIMDDAELLPPWLRFVRGVVDSNDLPLNVSRELLQQNADVEAMRSALGKRALDLIGRLAADEDATKYAAVWREFGTVLKEGLAADEATRGKLLPLLRFSSTHGEGDAPDVALADYVARMRPGQQHIYYLVADSVAAARTSPYIERLAAKGVEVLLLADRIDEWAMSRLDAYEGKHFQDATRGDLDLGAIDAGETARHDAAVRESKPLLKRIKDALGERVTEVRVSRRLAETPACLVLGEHEAGAQMRRILAGAGQKVPQGKPVLEVNVGHPLVQRLDGLAAGEPFDELAQLLYDQAVLAEAGEVANPGDFVRRLNRVLLQLAALR